MKRKLKRVLHQTASGTLLFNRVRVWREKLALRRLDDYAYITTTYRERFGREINLADPVTYTEKLQWLKLFHRDPQMPICSDKYAVRDYVEGAGLGDILNGVIGVYDSADKIDFDSLPNRFVIKATHGSGWNLVCNDKSEVNWSLWRRIANSWLRLDLSVFGREWHYREIKPRLIVEEFITIEPLIDYKFMCFNGEPLFVQINHVRDGRQCVDFYDIEWNKADMTYRRYVQSSFRLPQPPRYDQMVDLARTLSSGFPFVRVDFYADDAKVIFGELTFFPGGGLQPILPRDTEYDRLLGDWMALPPPNHNLDLLAKLKSG